MTYNPNGLRLVRSQGTAHKTRPRQTCDRHAMNLVMGFMAACIVVLVMLVIALSVALKIGAMP